MVMYVIFLNMSSMKVYTSHLRLRLIIMHATIQSIRVMTRIRYTMTLKEQVIKNIVMCVIKSDDYRPMILQFMQD